MAGNGRLLAAAADDDDDSHLSLLLASRAMVEVVYLVLQKHPGYKCAFHGMLFQIWWDRHQIFELALLPNNLGHVDGCIYNNPCR